MTVIRGRRTGVVRLAALVVCGTGLLAPGCGSAPSPAAGPSPLHGTSVLITGPSRVIVGGSAQLTAAISFADGTQKACPGASWSSSAATTASVSSSGLLQGLAPGDATITAGCDSASGTLSVATLAKVVVQGTLHESAPTTSTAITGGTVAVLDALGQQLSATSDAAGHFSVTAAAGPATLQASSAGYQPASLTPSLTENGGPIDVALSPVNQDVVLSGSAAMCSMSNALMKFCVKDGITNQSSHFPIDVHNPGTITIQTWWRLDFADTFWMDVTCGNQSLFHFEQRDSSTGKEFTIPVPGGCRYDVAFRLDSGQYPTVKYQYAIKHPS